MKFGGKRVRVCDVVDKGCVFALHDLRQSYIEGFQAAVTLKHHLFGAHEEEEKQCKRRTL